MFVLYVNFGSKVRLGTFGCVAMGNAMLFILRSGLFLCTAECGLNRVYVVLFGFCVRVFCFVKAKNSEYVWMYVFLCCTRVCVRSCDGAVICVGHDLNRSSGWWYVCSVNVEWCW